MEALFGWMVFRTQDAPQDISANRLCFEAVDEICTRLGKVSSSMRRERREATVD